jgi:hypothetical protein
MDSDLEHALVVLRYWFGPDLARDLNVTPHDCRMSGSSERPNSASLPPIARLGRLHMTQADGSG